MPRRIETHFLAGPAGRLEALLEEPEEREPEEAVVVCHPHPQHGGTMHNKVVYRMARGLRKQGAVVLRFNYRGVNLSEGAYDQGRGETEDARTALEWLRERYPELPYSLAGFSFGSRITLHLGCQLPDVQRLIPVGFPTRHPIAETLYTCAKPKFFVHSTNDEHGPRPALEVIYEKFAEPKRLDWVEATDHFFKDGLDAFESVITALPRSI